MSLDSRQLKLFQGSRWPERRPNAEALAARSGGMAALAVEPVALGAATRRQLGFPNQAPAPFPDADARLSVRCREATDVKAHR